MTQTFKGLEPVTTDREALANQIGRVLYECEKRRADHTDRMVGLKASTMEPWEECKDVFLSDAEAVLAALRASTGSGEAKSAINYGSGNNPCNTTHREHRASTVGEETVTLNYADFLAAYQHVPRSKMFPDDCLKTKLRALLHPEDVAHADEAEALSSSTGSAPSGEEGWVMVPKEPTEEMLKAGANTTWGNGPRSARAIYRAMIAAVPAPPAAKE